MGMDILPNRHPTGLGMMVLMDFSSHFNVDWLRSEIDRNPAKWKNYNNAKDKPINIATILYSIGNIPCPL